MSNKALIVPPHPTSLPQVSAVPWTLACRVAFRFCFMYLGLFCLSTQIFGNLVPLPGVDLPDLATVWPMRPIILWAGAHILRITHPLVYADTGSGDRTFDWVLVFCLLIVAAAATGVWSILDRKRENYSALYKWFRLFIRFALATQMILYGMLKLIPLQMPFPFLTKLIEPFGNFSPLGVLWYSIGASPAYETFTGCAETLGGLLLILPRTTLLGALICLADTIQVFTLNMTYDVPVELLSFHLLLLSSFLIAPELSRLADFFFWNRAVRPSAQPELFHTNRANRIALAGQVLLGLWIVGMNVYGGWSGWHTNGGGRPKSPFYGIWNVEQLSIDGQLRSPLLTDYDRWRRAIFDFPKQMSFQRMNDTGDGYAVSINETDKTMTLTRNTDKTWTGNFTFQRPTPQQLILDGSLGGHKMHMQLELVDRNKFLLVNRGFHWIQESPFNR